MGRPLTLRSAVRVASWVAAAFFTGQVARGDEASDKRNAEALFIDAGRLVDAGEIALACPKYEASLRLYEGISTRYFLADCYEQTGREASALALYLDVATRAAALGDEAESAKARERAGAVRSKVSTVTVTPPEVLAEGFTMTRDGAPLGREEWGVAIPVDAGTHVIEASAPGRRTWRTSLSEGPEGERAAVVVPPLLEMPQADGAETGDARAGRRRVAVVVGAAGLVGLATSAVLGLTARAKFDDAKPDCNGDRCDQRGMDLRSAAVTRANVATGVGLVGAAALGAGAVLWLTAPKATNGGSIGLVPTPFGVSLHGVF